MDIDILYMNFEIPCQEDQIPYVESQKSYEIQVGHQDPHSVVVHIWRLRIYMCDSVLHACKALTPAWTLRLHM